MKEVETAKYRITGLVDFTDEQGVIKGQLPIGSIQVLPVEVGVQAVADGRAEAVAEAGDEDKKPEESSNTTTPAPEAETSSAIVAPESSNDSSANASGEGDTSGGQGKVE